MIKLTDHAKERMKNRRITKKQVLKAFRDGKIQNVGTDRNKLVCRVDVSTSLHIVFAIENALITIHTMFLRGRLDNGVK